MTRCEPIGRYFHRETMGAVDGPGIRLVLFLQGCPIRCPYCHNPEGWAMEGGEPITAEETLTLLRRYEGYYADGGLTLSGGEPLLQAAFVRHVLERCGQGGFHTALDTSACLWNQEAAAACREADLLLLDMKHADPAIHQERFGFPLKNALAALSLRDDQGSPVWLRQVIAPGLTDSPAYVDRLAALARAHPSIQRIELLPFRNLCLEKYRSMGIAFPMENAPPPSADAVEALRNRLREELPAVAVR